MQRTELLNIIAIARAAFPQTRDLSDETVEVYWRALQGFDARAVEDQLTRHIANEQFFPRISDLKPKQRPQLGPQALPAPKMRPGNAIANIVMLDVLLKVGGVTDAKLKELVLVKNAEVDDYDPDAMRDPKARAKWRANLRRELEDQLCSQ